MFITGTKIFYQTEIITMVKIYDESFETNHNQNWLYIPDHPYRILIVGGSESEKTNVLLNLIKHHPPDFDKIYLFIKDPFESKHQLFMNRQEEAGTENFKKSKSIY